MPSIRRFFVPVTLALGAVAGPVSHARRGEALEKPNMPTSPSTTKDCTYWYDNDGKDSCQQVVWSQYITMEDFLQWNPSLGPNCRNFKANMSYCIDAPTPKAVPDPTLPLEAPPKSTSHNESPSSVASTPATPANGVSTPSPLQPDLVDNCKTFYMVKGGDSCDKIAKKHRISSSQFTKWNPSVGKDCLNLWKGVNVCVGIIGQEAPSPTNTEASQPLEKKPSNGIETPTPMQPDMVGNCKSFYMVKKGDTCEKIAKSKGISQSDFSKWNPSVGKDCKNLWADVNVCTSVTKDQNTPTKKGR